MNGRVAVIVCPTMVEQVAELPILVATNNTISIMPEVMPLAYAFTVPWDQALPAENIQVRKSGKRLRKCIWQKNPGNGSLNVSNDWSNCLHWRMVYP